MKSRQSSPKSNKRIRTSHLNTIPNPQSPYIRGITTYSQLARTSGLNPITAASPPSQRVKSPTVMDNLPHLRYSNNNPNNFNNYSNLNINNYASTANSNYGNNPQNKLMKNNFFRTRSSHSLSNISNDKYLRHESVLEAFLLNSSTMPLYSAIEETISLQLKASTVTFWQDIPSLHVLYSDRVHRTVKHSDGLVGFTFFAREVIKAPNCAQHSAYNDEIDTLLTPPGTPVILFPLWDSNNNVCSVVEVTRDSKDPFFDEEDELFIQFFIKKFKVFSPWLYNQKFPHKQCLELNQLMEIEQYLILFQRKIPDLFNCSRCEIWRYNESTKILEMFRRSVTVVDITKAGVAGESILKGCTINCAENKLQSSYYQEIDGSEVESVLAVPLVDMKQRLKYAVVIRGRKDIPVFTTQDEQNLRDLAPYLVMALDNNEKYSNSGKSDNRNDAEHRCVEYMKKINSMLSEGSTIKEIVKESVENIEGLTNSDRTMLFTYDKRRSVLVSLVATSMKSEVIKSLDDKIVGETYRTGKLFNISDAYEELIFDTSFDLEFGYKTKTMVSAPVFNNRKEVIGVIQLLNKRDGKPFSNNDLSYLSLFGQYCGLLIENQKLYDVSFESTAQLTAYSSISNVFNTSKNIKSILNDILQNAKKVIGADRASLFLLDEVVGALTTYLADGGSMPLTIPLKNGIAATSANKKESIFVNDPYHDPRFNKLIDFNTGFRTRSVLSVPVLSSDGKVLGVAELINKTEGVFTKDDMELMENFAVYISAALEKKQLKEITERGLAEIEMSKWIGDYERKSYKTPMKLVLPQEKQKQIFELNFFCIEYNGIGLFKVAFAVFNAFNLLERFQIPNELFFTFLYKLRSMYNEPPYHNWIHAIDVLQYFAYQIHKASFDNVLTGLELLAICVASICHDIGHEGLNNVYNVNAKTPLGILYKDQSVMETHHCELAIHIISLDECNIFHALQPNELKNIWNWIIQMILATDMAHHFKLVKNANDIMDQGPINLANTSHRIMAMTMLMKVADISNVSRPFEIADKWCEILTEEFWRQGDLELQGGLEISSPLNDRKNCNKPKGQIGFYNYICIPLYSAIARIFPELEVNVEAVKSNLEKWKELFEDQQTNTAPPQPKS
ncbi:3'5'-cyclic nucleotide phosphodiesterase family protein [Tritrichomonas foetus]|uniref:Phosphodiesterase n=1 Tax=Tritrichomonas foetus TaxID=1144522 RepID=A0A1J4JB09_9EUKA|nr:3'5'-cyclic nucleotide phosphodiesterase family protein [Tritrichomonas foetus]|eukprot:OHS95423.1 3'5'-cyclic nucleotide phosphodiesterase family protein [Tritrichomonas foetus]